MSRRVADLLVETLQAAGVKTCYGIVGGSYRRWPIQDAGRSFAFLTGAGTHGYSCNAS